MAAQAEREAGESAMWRRTSLLIVGLVLVPMSAWAARYALVRVDGYVVTVVDYPGDPNVMPVPPEVTQVVPVPDGAPAESGGSYVAGVFTSRPPSIAEQIGQRLDAAIDANKTFLAITAPTSAQAVAQVQALTRQVQGLLRLQRGRLDAVDN